MFLCEGRWTPARVQKRIGAGLSTESQFPKRSNIIRKIAPNSVKLFKDKNNSERPLSKIMFACLLNPSFLLPLSDIPQN